jgi:hypothetical protein
VTESVYPSDGSGEEPWAAFIATGLIAHLGAPVGRADTVIERRIARDRKSMVVG